MRAPTFTPYSLFASAPLQALVRAPAQAAHLLMPARGAGFIFTAALLAMLCALQLGCLWFAPPAWYPAAITVKAPASGGELALGQKELAAPQADRRHLALRRDPDGRWWIRNLAAGKQLILQRAGADERMGAAQLVAGQSFQVGAARFEVAAGDGRSIDFMRDGVHWTYDGAVLRRDGRTLDGCADAHWAARALSWWNRLAPRAVSVGRPLGFGGNVYCDNRLGLEGVTPGAAWIARVDGRLQLGAGNPDGEAAALLVSGAKGQMENLREREQNLDGVDAVIAGHTRFTVAQQDGQLVLAPSRRITLYSAQDLRLPDGVAWTWRQRALWAGDGGPLHAALSVSLLLAVAAAFAGVCAELFLPAGDAWHWRGAALAAVALLAGGIASLLLQRAGQPPAAAVSLLLGGAALWCWLLTPGRLSLATGAAVVLLAAGLLVQLEMGLGGMESSWLRYYQKSAALLALGCGAGGLWRAWSRHAAQTGRPGAGQRGIEWSLALLAAVALAGLAAEVLWGDETGVFDLQPVELAKLALTFLAAHCLALRLGWLDQGHASPTPHWERWLHLIAPVLLFVALTCLALVQVDDFSPLILLLVWSTAMAFAYALAARKTWLAVALGALVMAVVGAIVWLRCVGTDDLIQWGFYADRFLVWLDPAEHPHTGQQLLLGARAIGDGGWWGVDHALGLLSLGQSAGGVVRIPAVQDDFAPAFFMNRHGLAGALLLWAAQAALITGMAATALRTHRAAGAARDFRQAWLNRFRYFALCGAGAFVLGHFLLSWGTNLAIFPIMGQPMSFLSAGGSHLLFFLCPLLTLNAVSAHSLEENTTCRSTSNTKS